MSIVVENLSYTYMPKTPYRTTALKDITHVNEGEFVGLIGATGSGKSTLIQHFNGLIKLADGRLTVFDFDLSAKKINYKALRKGIGMLFQYPEYQLFEETVLKDIMFGPKNFGMSKEEAYESAKRAIELVGLDFEEIKDRSPFEISGGEKKGGYSRGFAYKPKALILDEPTAGLDPSGKKEILELITKLKKSDAVSTIIMISHNMDEIAAYAERIIVLNNSRLIYDLPPKELFKKDDLQEMGLDLPITVKIKNALAQRGMVLDTDALTAEELVAAIKQKIRGNNG